MVTEVVVPQGDRLWQKRVFLNSPHCRFQGTVHEQLVHPLDWTIKKTRAEIKHWGYADGVSARQKGLRNLELLVSAPETAQGDFYHLYQLGRTLYNLRFFPEAQQHLIRAIKIGKKANLESNQDLPLDNLKSSDLDPTNASSKSNPLESTEASSPLVRNPVSPSLWKHCFLLLSQVQLRLGQADEAERTLRTLLRLKPDYGPARAQLGRFLYDGAKFSECIKEFKKALALGCGDPSWGADPIRQGFICACHLAKAKEKLGLNTLAKRAWQEAININPDNPEPWVALAESALAEGQNVEARVLLEQAIRLAPAHRRAKMLEASL
jgi:tetratricopeptide (TPR) repeat protein